MIGISLNPAWLMQDVKDEFALKLLDSFGGRDEMLDCLKRAGVGSIELRTITPDMDPDDILDVFILLLKRSFNVTVHGTLRERDSAEISIFAPLSKVLRDCITDRLVITVHPLPSGHETIKALTLLSDYAKNYHTEIVFALENNRLMPDGSEGESSSMILDLVRAVNRSNVRICWDFGHMWYNVCRYKGGDRSYLPSRDFMRYAVQTHIHGVHGERLTTHFPPDRDNVPLEEWMDRVDSGTVFNFEPEPRRYPTDSDYRELLLKGIRNIASCVSPTRAAIDELRANDREIWKSASSVIDAYHDCFSLCGPSSYIIRLGSIAFAVDPCVRQNFSRQRLPDIANMLKGLKYIFITHEHVDHYDTFIMRALSGSGTKWIIPDFIRCDYLQPDEIITARKLSILSLDGMTALPFSSLHYRPGSSNGIPEYGYIIKCAGKMIFMPGDIRDYSYDDLPDCRTGKGIDLMFAHLWMGDNAAGNFPCEPYRSQFADFIAAFKPRRAAITHLYESGRERDSIWTYAHAGIAADAVFARNPNIDCFAPRLGRIYDI